jgi:hypothetical protein
MERSEENTALAAGRLLRQDYPDGSKWLLRDGSLFQFSWPLLTKAEPLRQIVGVVKSHPVPFFGIEGEAMLARMAVGDRSVAFLPSSTYSKLKGSVAGKRIGTAILRVLTHSQRPVIAWYLRVREADLTHPGCYSGIVRLDIAATDDWQQWVDKVSWAVLDEFYGLSSLPDSRADVLAYGIHDCELSMSAGRLPGELLLATLAN